MSNPNKIDEIKNFRTQTKFSNQEIQILIDKTETTLINEITDYQHVSAYELLSYFDEDTPSRDLTTLSDILDNHWLLIHELVELSELKNMNLEITSTLLRTHPTEVDHAHITATEFEFKFAKESGDQIWIDSRLKDVTAWFEDDKMPQDLKSRCQMLIVKYSE